MGTAPAEKARHMALPRPKPYRNLSRAQFSPPMESPRQYLQIACDQQADAELTFLYDHMPVSQIRASFTALGPDYVSLRAERDNPDDRHVISGHPCRCYFSIRDASWLDFSFTSRVERFYNGPCHSIYIILSIPRGLDMQRRRFAKRLEFSGVDDVPIAVWHGFFEQPSPGGLPVLAWRELAAPAFRLAEISASGCRVMAAGDGDPIGLEDNILLKCDFDRKKGSSLYLLGNAVRKSALEGETAIGCRFRAWRRTGSPPKTWYLAVEGEGIGAVGEWVLRRSFPGRGKGGAS